MDRIAEYDALMVSLSETPLKLDYAVDRARPRYQRWKKRRCVKRAFGIPLGTVAALCAAFIVLVNASPAFAQAAERVPWLAEFADCVLFTPSVGHAAQTGALQKRNQTQEKNGAPAGAHNALSDKQQVSLYYTLGDGAAFTVDGQKFAVTEVSISPTEMHFKIRAAEENTAWLESLSFYFENENGERFSSDHATERSWHSRGGEGDIVFAGEDSPYYAGGEHLTLCVTGAVWMAKDRSEKDGKGKPVHIDLANKSADFLPEGIVFESAERTKSGWQLRFSGPLIDNAMYSIWSSAPCNANGLDINSGQPTESSSIGLDDSRMLETLPIENYTASEVWLRPNFTSYTALDKPVKVKLK